MTAARLGRPPVKYAANDPRFAQAIALKEAHPDWTIERIAAAAGIGRDRCRDVLADAVLPLRHGYRRVEPLAAPSWYDRPPGRIMAQRQAHGIEIHG